MQFVPFEKLSKRKQKELNDKKRNGWGQLNPVTCVSKVNRYDRKKAKKLDETSTSWLSFLV
jgi:hypothetical protein